MKDTGLWMMINLKDVYISNAVSDTVEISEVEKKCYNMHTYYLCYPEEVEITHSAKSCELQLIENYWGNPTNFSQCLVDQVVIKPVVQKSLMIQEGLTIASAIRDNLTYICEDSSKDKVTPVEVGVAIYKYRKGCVYETSTLTIYNSVKSEILFSNFSEGVDREIDVISALTEIQTQLDDFMDSNSFNISYEKIINMVHAESKDFSISVTKFKTDIKNFKDLQSLNVWNPTHFSLEEPTRQSNVLSAVFWVVMVIALVTIIGCCYKCCPCCCPAIAAGFKAVFMAIGKSCRFCYKRATANRTATVEDDIEASMSLSGHEMEHLPRESIFAPPRSAPPSRSKDATLPSPAKSTASASDPSNLRRRQLPTAPPASGMRLYPDVEDFYVQNKPEVSWRTVPGEDNEKTLSAYIPNGQGAMMRVFFDILSNQVVDRFGYEMRFIPKPSRQMIALYKDQVARMPVPKWHWDEQRLITMESNPLIKFDQTRKVWYNQVSNRPIPGFPPPLFDEVTYDALT